MVLKNTHIKIADFGEAQIITKSTRGSMPFSSPELILGYSSLYSGDIWAFGVTLFQLSSTLLPFKIHGSYSPSRQDRIRLRLIELFCERDLPRELIDSVDSSVRKCIFKHGQLSHSIIVENATVLGVRFSFKIFSNKCRRWRFPTLYGIVFSCRC